MADTIVAPVPVMVRRFECPFCRHRRSAMKAAAAHIARCWLNPAVKACKTCAHFTDEPGSGEYCEAGRPCPCDQGYRKCEAGIPEVADGEIKTACPLWLLKGGSDG
jgi:hypothetical protein